MQTIFFWCSAGACLVAVIATGLAGWKEGDRFDIQQLPFAVTTVTLLENLTRRLCLFFNGLSPPLDLKSAVSIASITQNYFFANCFGTGVFFSEDRSGLHLFSPLVCLRREVVFYFVDDKNQFPPLFVFQVRSLLQILLIAGSKREREREKRLRVRLLYFA